MVRQFRQNRKYDIEEAREAFRLDPNKGRELYEALIQHYVTENTLLQDELEIDPLMRILNRRTLSERLVGIHAEALSKQVPYSIVFADIDDFGKFNKDYGHVVGDGVLTESADRIRVLLRKDDLVFRYGGEEILVVAPKTNEEGAAGLLQKIVTGFNSGDLSAYLRAKLKDGRKLTISAGAATWNPGQEPLDVITRANYGMLTAKRMPGKGSFYLVKAGEEIRI